MSTNTAQNARTAAAVAACRLDSLLRGGIALVPPALGLVAAAPLVWGSLGQADELTLFALAAAVALVLPAAADAADAANAADTGATDSGSSGARLYRALRRQTPWLLGTIPALILGLALPTLGADPSALRQSRPTTYSAPRLSRSINLRRREQARAVWSGEGERDGQQQRRCWRHCRSTRIRCASLSVTYNVPSVSANKPCGRDSLH